MNNKDHVSIQFTNEPLPNEETIDQLLIEAMMNEGKDAVYYRTLYGGTRDVDGRRVVEVSIQNMTTNEIVARHPIDVGPVPPKPTMWQRIIRWIRRKI